MIFFSVGLGLGWGVFGGGGDGVAEPLLLCERERMDVLGNSNKLARSFVGLELRSHCFLLFAWTVAPQFPRAGYALTALMNLPRAFFGPTRAD